LVITGSEALGKDRTKYSQPTAEDIRLWLEWAGSKLLAMNIASPAPKDSGSYWPEYRQDNQAYGYTQNRLRAGLPNRHEIDLMDEILGLPSLVNDITIRRILNARALVTPVANRYVYSWSKIAIMIYSERRRVVRLHFIGLCEIANKVSPDKASTFKQSLQGILLSS
jgi:hypothetical protein